MKMTRKPISSETLDITAVEVSEVDMNVINTQDKEESSRIARHSEFGDCPIHESAQSQGCDLGNLAEINHRVKTGNAVAVPTSQHSHYQSWMNLLCRGSSWPQH